MNFGSRKLHDPSNSAKSHSKISHDHRKYKEKHPMESLESWLAWTRYKLETPPSERQQEAEKITFTAHRHVHRRRLHHHKHKYAKMLEKDMESQFWKDYQVQQAHTEAVTQEQRKEHLARVQEIYTNSGIAQETQHGIMIDAGSTGSRLHVYEWEPRILRNASDIQAAVSGSKLSFPGTESRWTDRLRPGLSTFATVEDDIELVTAVQEYLQPLLDFAKSVLHTKEEKFNQFPIYLRATAGMRLLNANDRARVVDAVRTAFHNETYCAFQFTDEQARVISGEEEAVYDWAGVNFLLGDLVSQSQGAGTVISPQLTHGALDMGGGSTQISFFEPNEDIMSNLFKLQIGQAKHWNIYAHSFLFYGINEAMDRFHAKLASNKTREERMIYGIYNPCLPHSGAKLEIRTNIHHDKNNVETWDYSGEHYPSGNGYFQATLVNDLDKGNANQCFALVKDLLHLEENSWCEFVHGDCSFAGIYQPSLPADVEFVAFSNYYHIWKFLHLPERATLSQLEKATRHVCSLSHDELEAFNTHSKFTPDLDSYCFRSAYAFQLLHNGYGFALNDTIRVTNVIDAQKVGWALGAILFEINTMPWQYSQEDSSMHVEASERIRPEMISLVLITMVVLLSLFLVFVNRERRLRRMYEPIKDLE